MNFAVTHSVKSKDAPGKREPKRTCVACRRQSSPPGLMRLTCAPDGDLVVDWRRNLGGRGVHVCISRECVCQAISARSLDRTLKAKVRYPSSDELLKSAIRSSMRNLSTLLASGAGANALFVGADATSAALRDGKVGVLVLAQDFTSREEFEAKANELSVGLVESKEQLGDLLGRRPTGIVGIAAGRLAEAVALVFDRVKKLS